MPDSDLDRYIVRHEEDEYAHSPMRHALRNEVTAEALGLRVDLNKLEARMNQHDLAHASAGGELRGIMNTLRLGFSALGALLVTFGSVVLLHLWGKI